MKRSNGYYWVNRGEDWWIIAEWNDDIGWAGTHWLIAGEDDLFKDEEFTEIDETPITRK